VGSKVIVGLPKLREVLDVSHQVIANYLHLFLGGKQLHPRSQVLHRGLHWVDKALLQELLLALKSPIKAALPWCYHGLELSSHALKVWIKVTGPRHLDTLANSTSTSPTSNNSSLS
jgi:hypothetical protein